MKQKILQLACLALFLSSCNSMRIANRIEMAFLRSYKQDTAKGIIPRTYRVTDKYRRGDVQFNRHTGTFRTGITTRLIDVYLKDTLTNSEVIIDDFKGIQRLTKNNKLCQPYLKKLTRQKTMQKIHRYGSYAMIVGGLAMLASVDETGTESKSEKIKGNTGALIFLGGFLNWIGGGLNRSVMRRATIMKAAYVYHYGKPPKSWKHLKREKNK